VGGKGVFVLGGIIPAAIIAIKTKRMVGHPYLIIVFTEPILFDHE